MGSAATGALFRKGYTGHSALVELFDGAGVCVKWTSGTVDVFPTAGRFTEWLGEESLDLRLDDAEAVHRD